MDVYVKNSGNDQNFYIYRIYQVYNEFLVNSKTKSTLFFPPKKRIFSSQFLSLLMFLAMAVGCFFGYYRVSNFIHTSSPTIATMHNSPQFMIQNAVKNCNSSVFDTVYIFIEQQKRFPSPHEIKLIVQEKLINFFANQYMNLDRELIEVASNILERRVTLSLNRRASLTISFSRSFPEQTRLQSCWTSPVTIVCNPPTQKKLVGGTVRSNFVGGTLTSKYFKNRIINIS